MKKAAVITPVLLVFGLVIWKVLPLLNFDYLVQQESQLLAFKESNPTEVILAAILLYVVVTGLSLPGALIMTLVYGWYFKLALGVLIVSFSSTLGATLAFLISRYFLRDFVHNKFGERVNSMQQKMEKEGAHYLFSLRMIPVFPFWLINLVIGLTRIKVWTFWWVSQLGMLPATFVVVLAGSGVPTLTELQENGTSGLISPVMIAGFILLGFLPFILKFLMPRLEKHLKPSPNESGSHSIISGKNDD